jgi:hypothetical protein
MRLARGIIVESDDSRAFGWIPDQGIPPPLATPNGSGSVNPPVGSRQLLEGLLVAAVLLIILSFAWALPLDRSFTGRRPQLGRMVHPAELAFLLYQPPNWDACEVDSYRGATWKIHEHDVVLRVEVNPPDQDAPS